MVNFEKINKGNNKIIETLTKEIEGLSFDKQGRTARASAFNKPFNRSTKE